MKKRLSLTPLIIAFFVNLTFGQTLTQTVRGTVVDSDSRLPLVNAEVIIVGSEPFVGTATDANGEFRLTDIPIGRITLRISYLGYESKTLSNIVVNSGKEVVLNLSLRESVLNMNEVVVTPDRKKGEALDEMSLLSARSISVEETRRYANSYNDPSHIVTNFAGVTKTHDGSNDVIVRGNSPKYVQWRLEGVEITNPNHFAVQNGIGSGGLSALNNNLLTTSDFYTSAFSPEYGNALSGVYDIKLRAGNNEHFESTFGFGLLGTDFTAEGPFGERYGGSYLVNYRYSTVSMINGLGLIDINGTPKFQDLNYKVVLPTGKIGRFSLFGVGGYSSAAFNDVDPGLWDMPGDRAMIPSIREDMKKDSYLFNTGLNHTLSINNNSFFQSSLSFSREGILDDVFESKLIDSADNQGNVKRDSTAGRRNSFKGRIKESTYRGSIKYNLKLNAKDKIEVGSKYSLHAFDFKQSRLKEDGETRFTIADFDEYVGMFRNYISWKHRFNEDVTLVSGFHNLNVLLNKKSTLEPRIALNWDINDRNSIHAGYGNHSTMPSIHNYFARVEQQNGNVVQPNKDLGLLKAHHFVIGYEKRFSRNLMTKMEVYYQDLYNLPVENIDTSYYATLNEGIEFRYVDLVNKGTGENYGVEVTVERFFDNNYYFLVNGSLYNSTYKSLEGVERNTQYNGNYLFNLLAGKEFRGWGIKNNQTFSLNLKLFYTGGKKILPLLRDDQGDLAVDPENNRFWDYKNAYETKIDDVHSIILTASYKFNRPDATHEIYLNLDNLTDAQARLKEFYDESAPNNIGYLRQLTFFPNLMYKVHF